MLRIGWALALCLGITLGWSRPLPAEEDSSILISIENPEFRKVLMAVPVFFVDDSVKDAKAKEFATEGADELARLLNFSRLFNIMDRDAYEDFLASMAKRHKTEDDADWLVNLKTLKADDWSQWKALGVESLTLGSLKQTAKNGLVLSMKTFDINRREELIAKQFQKITDFDATLRRYGDFILEKYTGKPGIFNSRLAFVGKRSESATKQIFIADFDGSNARQISKGKEPHVSPAWSPDGRYLAYTSFKGRAPHLYIYDTKNGSTRKLTTKQGLNSGANWSPNGKLIAFTGSRGGDTDIYVITPSGTDRRLLIEGSGLDVDPKFSPDGQWMAFVSGRYGNPHIFISALKWESDTKVKVTSDKRLTYAGWYNSTPDWGPESDKIAFGGYDKDIDRYDIFMMNPDGKKLERLTLKTGDNESPSWAPNGQMLVFQSNRVGQSNAKGRAKLFVMSRDGSHQRALSIDLHEAQTPDWSSQIPY